MRHDYKLKETPAHTGRRPVRRHHVAALVSCAVVAGLVALWADGPAEGKQIQQPARGVEVALPLPQARASAAGPAIELSAAPQPEHSVKPVASAVAGLPDAAALAAVIAQAAPVGERMVLEVQRGDSLDRLFRRHELSVNDLHRLLALGEVAPHLKRVRPGDTFEIRHDGPSVLGLSRRIDEGRSLLVELGEEGYAASFLEHPVEVRLARAAGQITSSFYAAGLAAGLSDGTIMRLAGIYAWDIDFALEIRRDDWFSVVYEEIWQDGEKLRDGEIVAAEFSNQGRSFRAVRFPDEDGRPSYYTPEGNSMRKAFLRAPVDFTRVSSNFNPNRLHPVLKTKRPHRGVDYAARTGTPIMAAGDGKVISAGTQGGYGKTVVLQHGGNVTTLYAHMSRIAPASKVGRRVKQGDIIGYVGATGLASGPHLHYEYRVNGAHMNPRTVALPQAEPVPAARRDEFVAVTTPLIAELDRIGLVRLAAVD